MTSLISIKNHYELIIMMDTTIQKEPVRIRKICENCVEFGG